MKQKMLVLQKLLCVPVALCSVHCFNQGPPTEFKIYTTLYYFSHIQPIYKLSFVDCVHICLKRKRIFAKISAIVFLVPLTRVDKVCSQCSGWNHRDIQVGKGP